MSQWNFQRNIKQSHQTKLKLQKIKNIKKHENPDSEIRAEQQVALGALKFNSMALLKQICDVKKQQQQMEIRL